MTEESFVMVSLKDEKSKKLAEVISNKTARKILDILTKKEYTESELAKELSLPISTIHYNLKHLMKAKLVTVDEFHYSEKGKEVNHYKLANKFVIITPSETPPDFMDKLKKILPITLLVTASAVLLKVFNFFTLGPATMMSKSGESLVRTASPEVFTIAEEAADMAVEEVAEEAVQDTAFYAAEPMSEAISTIPYTEYLFWFLIGVIFSLFIYILIEYIKNRRRK